MAYTDVRYFRVDVNCGTTYLGWRWFTTKRQALGFAKVAEPGETRVASQMHRSKYPLGWFPPRFKRLLAVTG